MDTTLPEGRQQHAAAKNKFQLSHLLGIQMTIRPELIEKLRAKRDKLTENVSPEKLEALHAKGLLSARERLDTLFAEGTFQELGLHAAHNATSFGMAGRSCPPTA